MPIPETWLYLTVDFFCIIFPFLFSFHPRLKFYKQWRYFFVPGAVTATLFVLWDALFTHMGVWGFNHRYVCGTWLLGLPLEEYLFFICIPYACVFTYHSLTTLIRFRPHSQWATYVSVVFIVLLLAVGLTHLPQAYTSVTCLLMAAALVLTIVLKAPYMGAFYVQYAAIYPMFLLSNGVLTGSFTEEPVVWYNNAENLGLRIFTIPAEDTFYGMLLLLMNIAGMEYLKARAARQSPAAAA